MSERQVISEEIDIAGPLTWAILRRGIDEFIEKHSLPDYTPIWYVDIAADAGLVGSFMVTYEDGVLSVG